MSQNEEESLSQGDGGLRADETVPLVEDLPVVSAIQQIKLPAFWVVNPEVWFARIEAQFRIRGISRDESKYNHVVGVIENEIAAEVIPFLNLTGADRYDKIKSALLAAFGKTQAQKDNEVLGLAGLGDRKPSAVLRYIQALNEDPKTLIRAVFLNLMPVDIKKILVASTVTSLEELATMADKIIETDQMSGVQAVAKLAIKKQPVVKWICKLHHRYGTAAVRCLDPEACSMARKGRRSLN
jgi:hypothetical protein